MTSRVAQLSSKLLTQQRFAQILKQRKWVQSLLTNFRLGAEEERTSVCAAPIVLPYGSVISGTSFTEGDVDYAVAFPFVSQNTKATLVAVIGRDKQEKVLSDIFAHIRENNSTVDLQPQRIFRARIPIVQYVHKSGKENAKFDLSLSIDGLKNSLLLRDYMASDARLRLGVLCVKQWGKEHQILNARRGWISPYALTIMYIHFMKSTGRTSTSVTEGDVSRRVDAIIRDVSCPDGDVDKIDEFAAILPLRETDSDAVKKDVYDFFRFFSDSDSFDFDVSVVDIRTRNPIKSKDEWCDNLKDLSDEERWHLLGHQNILLRDPFEPHSLGRSVDFFRGEEIREKFRTSALKQEPLSFLTPL